ncbi:MAG: nitroreductase [Selenomonadaceae bacterium]|nr:nitroreductase [Selenomonadaceae bacterium]
MKEALMNNETVKVLIERRSVKKYKSEQIKDEELETIIEAARYTASGHNYQPVKVVVVQDKATRDLLSQMNAKILGASIDPFYNAPTVIVVIADKSSPTYVEDGALVLGNLMNAAKAIGVDSCWINRAKETFETEEGKALLKKWGIEGDYAGIGNCILGYRDGEYPKAPARRGEYAVYVK